MEPFSPEFDALPRAAQARILRASGWTIESAADEMDVSETTIKRWTNPEYARRQREKQKIWSAGPGREKRRVNKAKYAASPKGIASRARCEARRASRSHAAMESAHV